MRSRVAPAATPFFELSDADWAAIAPLMPGRAPGPGRPSRDHRTVVAGILWVLENGAAWRHVPARFGPWQTLYARYTLWVADGTWERVNAALRAARRRESRRARVLALALLCVLATLAPGPVVAERSRGARRAVRGQLAHTSGRVGRRHARTRVFVPEASAPAR